MYVRLTCIFFVGSDKRLYHLGWQKHKTLPIFPQGQFVLYKNNNKLFYGNVKFVSQLHIARIPGQDVR